MTTRNGLILVGVAGIFVAGVVAFLTILARKVGELSQSHDELSARVEELRADVEAANAELLILRAEADLRQEQLRRLIKEGEDDWQSLN